MLDKYLAADALMDSERASVSESLISQDMSTKRGEISQRGRNPDDPQQGRDNKELLERRKALIDYKKNLFRIFE